jgi:hypothetical protein
MEQRALAAAGWPAKSNRLSRGNFEVHAPQDSDRSIVITLPHVLGAKDDASLPVQIQAA